MAERCYLGVDVGTGSVRAGVLDASGRVLGIGTHPIAIFRPAEDFVEQSSADIWAACGTAIRSALDSARIAATDVAGVGFDATCSLVLLDAGEQPVTVSPTGNDEQNVIVWMDHRAVDQARRINATGHRALRFVGNVISPEMELPKLLWLAENLPASFDRAARFLDLADFLVHRATLSDVRSVCTTACKWTYLAHEADGARAESGYARDLFEQIGLGAIAAEGYARIGREVRPQGERAGALTERAARELGLAPGTAVAVGIIDAHAGGLGLLGAPLDGVRPTAADLERRVALIGGTSSCHMAVSREPRYVPGVWGPYFSAMVPGLWLTEGGQSATGALIDHVIDSHSRGAELRTLTRDQGTTAYALLNERLDRLGREVRFGAELTRDLHVLPYFHGNRSPRADPSLRGTVSGLRLTDSLDALALLYLATIQAIAHGTRHILDVMNQHGHRIDTIFACGGDTRNSVFVREHADVTGCRVVLPEEPEAVLLGSAILGAVASGDQPSVLSGMTGMSRVGRVLEPGPTDVRGYHARKHAVFQRMYEDQMAYRRLMQGGGARSG